MKPRRASATIGALLVVGVLLWGCGSKRGVPTSPSPSPPHVSQVLVAAVDTTLSPGQTSQLTATATLSDGTTQNVTTAATWLSSSPTVVTVSAIGVVTALAPGEADVSATYQGFVGTARIAVAATPPARRAKLHLHFLDVGQGDAALLVSDRGQTVMFDDGVSGSCGKVVSYVRQLGLTGIDYHVASHYHADHIGCASSVFSSFPLLVASLDRGGSYSSQTYSTYVAAVSGRRQAVSPGMAVTLDAGSEAPVSVAVVSANGDGLRTDDENALSVVALVRFGTFHAVIGGDLTGSSSGGGVDVESRVASRVGPVEVYKVHHHGSRYSSNAQWLSMTTPVVGVVSVGAGNSYGHPHSEAMDRLHAAGVHTYWTTAGRGASPSAGLDTVSGDIVVEAEAASSSFSVRYKGGTDTYPTWEHATMGAREPWTPPVGAGPSVPGVGTSIGPTQKAGALKKPGRRSPGRGKIRSRR